MAFLCIVCVVWMARCQSPHSNPSECQRKQTLDQVSAVGLIFPKKNQPAEAGKLTTQNGGCHAADEMRSMLERKTPLDRLNLIPRRVYILASSRI